MKFKEALSHIVILENNLYKKFQMLPRFEIKTSVKGTRNDAAQMLPVRI